MRLFKNKFTLLELLIVIAVIGILITLLMPSLRAAKEASYNAVCVSNLAQINRLAHLHTKDNTGRLPAHSFHYKDDQLQGNETEADLFTGEAMHDASKRGKYWSENNIGKYLFPGGTNDYAKHAIYNCPSNTITTHQSTGEKIEFPVAYYVNTIIGPNGKSPWADNWGITDTRDVYFTNLSEITQPNELMSVYDCAVGWDGKVPASGAGGLISHAEDIWDKPDPSPWRWASPEQVIGRKLRPAQDGVWYWRGGVDFRHQRESLNSGMVDGSVRKLFNGRILNQNVINQ